MKTESPDIWDGCLSGLECLLRIFGNISASPLSDSLIQICVMSLRAGGLHSHQSALSALSVLERVCLLSRSNSTWVLPSSLTAGLTIFL